MTTVGYGDVIPTSDLGRVLAIVVMIVGIGFVALLTAALAERFFSRGEAEEALVGEEETAYEAQPLAAVRAELRAMADRLRELDEAVGRSDRA